MGRERFITQEPHAVAPELIGLRLATPGRRLVAMMVDLSAAGVIAAFGWAFVTTAAALLLGAAAIRQAPDSSRRWRRPVLLVSAGVLLLLTIAGSWQLGRSGLKVGTSDSRGGGFRTSVQGIDVPPATAAALVTDLIVLETGANDAEIRSAADRAAATIRRGLPDASRADDAVRKLAETSTNPVAREALLAAIATPREGGLPEDEARRVRLARSYAAALEAGDRNTAASLAEDLSREVGGPRVRALEHEAERLRREEAEVRKEAEERHGLLWLMATVADELGLSLGWVLAYFTASTVLGRGRTPGKRLVGIRVVRLDGKPIGWWSSFSRAGGYAASLFTGLLGFAEILWDENRQALHDKLSGTTVVRD